MVSGANVVVDVDVVVLLVGRDLVVGTFTVVVLVVVDKAIRYDGVFVDVGLNVVGPGRMVFGCGVVPLAERVVASPTLYDKFVFTVAFGR